MIFKVRGFLHPGDPPAYDLSSVALEHELLRLHYP